jgi:hypothetical protein
MDKYWSSMLSILISDSLLTSIPDPIGEKQKHIEKKDSIKYMASMRKQEWWHDMLKIFKINHITIVKLNGIEMLAIIAIQILP